MKKTYTTPSLTLGGTVSHETRGSSVQISEASNFTLPPSGGVGFYL